MTVAKLLAAALVSVVPIGSAWAQETVSAAAAKPQTVSKDTNPDWDVVTVKRSDPNETKDYMYMQGRHLIVHNETVQNILRLAYSVQDNQIVGAPDWAKTERYDVDGVREVNDAGQPGEKEFHGLVRKLLEERFGLKVHLEHREMPVFALTVAKGGQKLMTKSAGDPNGGPKRKVNVGSGQISNEFTNTSMPDLVLMLLFQVDLPMVDHTGLQGRYDFKLQWTIDDMRTTAPDVGPGLFTALQEQVGLKLETTKALADVVVIDRVERPGAN